MDQNNQYLIEIIPQEIFETMKYDIFTDQKSTDISSLDSEYIKKRKDIFDTIHKISNKLGFKSQTFFLAAYYNDLIILQNPKLTNQYYLLALGCLVISSKYSENDPVVPPLENFIYVFNKIKNEENCMNFNDLYKMEVQICKLLNYNLHYVTIYDFDFFFFNHGIIKKEQIRDVLKSNNDDNNENKEFVLDGNYVKKILENIYRKSRSYLNQVIYNEILCFKYNSLILSIYIMKKSVEFVILNEYKSKNKNYNKLKKEFLKKTDNYFKEIMDNFYKLQYESSTIYQELINDKEIIKIFPQIDFENNEIIYNKNKNIKKNITSSSTIDNIPSSNRLLKSLTLNENFKILNKKINADKVLYKKIIYCNTLNNQKNSDQKIESFDRNKNKNNSINNYKTSKINIKKNFSISHKFSNDRYSNTNIIDHKSIDKFNRFNKKSVNKPIHLNNSQSLDKYTYNNKFSSNNLASGINSVKYENSSSKFFRSTLYNEDKNNNKTKSVHKTKDINLINDSNNTKPYHKKVIRNYEGKKKNSNKAIITGLINKTNTIKNEYANNLSLSINQINNLTNDLTTKSISTYNIRKINKMKNKLLYIQNSEILNKENSNSNTDFIIPNRKTVNYTHQSLNSQEKDNNKDKNNNNNRATINTNNTNIIYNYYFSNNNYYTNNSNTSDNINNISKNNNISAGFYKNKIVGSELNLLNDKTSSNCDSSIGFSKKTYNCKNNRKIVNMKFCNLKNGLSLNSCKENNNNNNSSSRNNISPYNSKLNNESLYKKKKHTKHFSGIKNRASKIIRNSINSMKNLDCNPSKAP